MKKMLSLPIALITALCSVTVMADGFYTGVQLGQSKLDASATNLKVKSIPYLVNDNQVLLQGPSKVKVDNDGFAGRAYGGYQFNKYISLEGGYTQYADTKITNLYGISGSDETLHQGALDGVVKLTVPIAERVHLYAKGGGAYVFGQGINDANGEPVSSGSTLLSTASYHKVNNDALRPTYGFGIGVDMTNHISTDLMWSHIVGGNHIHDTYLTTLGVSYHFNQIKKV